MWMKKKTELTYDMFQVNWISVYGKILLRLNVSTVYIKEVGKKKLMMKYHLDEGWQSSRHFYSEWKMERLYLKWNFRQINGVN